MHAWRFCADASLLPDSSTRVETSLIIWPWLHVGCVMHDVNWCDLESSYVLIGQLEQVRLEVFESALIFWPWLHIGCVLHFVERCNLESWYVLLGHQGHVLFSLFDGAEKYLPSASHAGCVLQALFPLLFLSEYLFVGQNLQERPAFSVSCQPAPSFKYCPLAHPVHVTYIPDRGGQVDRVHVPLRLRDNTSSSLCSSGSYV